MQRDFLEQEALRGNKSRNKLVMIVGIVFVVAMTIILVGISGELKGSSEDRDILYVLYALDGVMIACVLLNMIKSLMPTKNGANLKLPFGEMSKAQAAEIINREAANGKLYIDEYIYKFDEGQKKYGQKLALTESYLLLIGDFGNVIAIPREKVLYICPQRGIKGQSNFIIKILVFTEKEIFEMRGADCEYVESLAEKLYQHFPNLFMGRDPFAVSYWLEELYEKRPEEFYLYYDLACQKWEEGGYLFDDEQESEA